MTVAAAPRAPARTATIVLLRCMSTTLLGRRRAAPGRGTQARSQAAVSGASRLPASGRLVSNRVSWGGSGDILLGQIDDADVSRPRAKASTSGCDCQPGERLVAELAAQAKRCAVELEHRLRVAGLGLDGVGLPRRRLRQPRLGAAFRAEPEGRRARRTRAAAPGSRRGPGRCCRSGATSGPAAARSGCPRPPTGPAPHPGTRRRAPGSASASRTAARARRVPSSRSVGHAVLLGHVSERGVRAAVPGHVPGHVVVGQHPGGGAPIGSCVASVVVDDRRAAPPGPTGGTGSRS